MKNSKLFLACVLIYLLTVETGFACGPYFDDAYLVRGSEEQFLSIPEGYFLYELERITGNKKKKAAEGDVSERSADKDVLDLEESLNRMNLSEGKKQKALASYAQARSQLLHYLKGYPVEKPWVWYGGSFRHHERGASRIPFRFEPGFNFAKEIPEEFVLYLRGAVAYHNNNFDIAIKTWENLLSLPENKRQYRSVWAAFMIGKTYLSMRELKEATAYFIKAREYASQGHKDSLGLAYDSYGWQALAEYERKDYTSSIHNYLKQLDVNSLNWLCRKIFVLGDMQFDAVIQDDISRNVLIGWAVSQSPWTYWYKTIGDDPTQNIYSRLLKAINKIEENRDLHNADRIALIFYNHGDFINTKKWLTLARDDSPLGKWINSKLLLREGKIEDALKDLRELIPKFEKNQEWSMFYKIDKDEITRIVNTEIGVLQLRRQDYITAFDTLIKGGACWEDIAYIAEKVLTTEELEKYLEQYSAHSLPAKMEWHYTANIETPLLHNALKYLLARRLVRNEDWDKAIEYMPTNFKRWWYEKDAHGRQYEDISPRGQLKKLYGYLQKTKNKRLSNKERAMNYYEAALIMRKYGMELVGTELDPDWFVFNGQFAYDDTAEQRFGIMNEERQKYYKDWYDEKIEQAKIKRKEIEKERNFFAGSKDEEERVLSSLPKPAKRFHYRYKASDLMWKAAMLLPDNNELKSKALCIGGSYIKIKDPETADKFYKTLVKTCAQTKLGKEAANLHWFPKIETEE